MSEQQKLVLIVIDGLTPAMLERAVETEDVPALRFLMSRGEYRRAVTTFPSLTPVCLSSIAIGAHPDVHEIPHLVWYHRGEQRLVEYGSSFGAVRAAGTTRTIRDVVFNLNEEHLSKKAVTVFEALEAAGRVTAAVNMVCYRGPVRHAPHVPWLTRPAYGPSRFFYFNLFESDVTGSPLAVRTRARGSVDEYARVVGRWLVTRDGFDFLVFYLPDYDYASHASGPEAAHAALAHADRAISALFEAAGGPEEFLERYAVLLCSDHRHASPGAVLEDASRVDPVPRQRSRGGDRRDGQSGRDGLSTAGCRTVAGAARLDGEPRRPVPRGRVRGGEEDATSCAAPMAGGWQRVAFPGARAARCARAPGRALPPNAGDRRSTPPGSSSRISADITSAGVCTVRWDGRRPDVSIGL